MKRNAGSIMAFQLICSKGNKETENYFACHLVCWEGNRLQDGGKPGYARWLHGVLAAGEPISVPAG
jgi:hypothetical protein